MTTWWRRPARLPTRPAVLSLDPTTLGEVLADVPRLARAAGAARAGEALALECAAASTRSRPPWRAPAVPAWRRSNGSIPSSWAVTGCR